MEHWEYSYMRTFKSINPLGEYMEADRVALNEKGSNGWQLVCLMGDYFLLKRPIISRDWTGPR